MADDIKYLRHTVEDIDEAIDMILEVYTREEINAKFAEIEARISALEQEEQKNVEAE
ncbi:MAG: hypothetical protein K2J32_15015 [Ruminococcus sp.]|nr:hypothetical protein [Ruminococcus sp.]